MNVQPATQFEAVLDNGTTGLASSIGVEVNDNLGGITIGYVTPVFEIAPGVYSVVLLAPSTAGQYSIVWRSGPGGEVLGVDDLVVTQEAPPPVGTPPAPFRPTGGMTYKQLQDECVLYRFGEGRRNSVKAWLNRRMQAVWGESEWPFKRINRAPVTTFNGKIVMPTGFRRAISVEDANGGILSFRDPELFRTDVPINSEGSTSDISSEYTVWGGQILTDAILGDGLTFYLSYLRRVCVFDADGVIREGLLTLDGDSPLWDPEFHYMLVLGATATGLKLENDFTWQALEDEFQQVLTEMKDDLLPPDTVGTTQYGADDLF